MSKFDFAGRAEDTNAVMAGQTTAVAPGVHSLQASGIENFYRLSDFIYSGSAPEGDAGFAALKERGIKTIITVDGTKPDVAMARRFGIRYVHLPIGYDGVPANQAMRLVKAAETLPGPIYVHCHHGLHRGPAAAAVVCMGTAGWTSAQAESWLRLAGTATNYTGLYQSVARFQPPTTEALKSVSQDFPEQSAVSPLADWMIQIDERLDHLKLAKKADYLPCASHPELDPAHEALLLDELFKELSRSSAIANHSTDFRAKLNQAEKACDQFQHSLRVAPVDGTKSDAAFQRVTDACASCHKDYRN